MRAKALSLWDKGSTMAPLCLVMNVAALGTCPICQWSGGRGCEWISGKLGTTNQKPNTAVSSGDHVGITPPSEWPEFLNAFSLRLTSFLLAPSPPSATPTVMIQTLDFKVWHPHFPTSFYTSVLKQQSRTLKLQGTTWACLHLSTFKIYCCMHPNPVSWTSQRCAEVSQDFEALSCTGITGSGPWICISHTKEIKHLSYMFSTFTWMSM